MTKHQNDKNYNIIKIINIWNKCNKNNHKVKTFSNTNKNSDNRPQ